MREKYFLKREVKYIVCTNLYRSMYQYGNYKHFNHNSYWQSEQNSYEMEIMVKLIFSKIYSTYISICIVLATPRKI